MSKVSTKTNTTDLVMADAGLQSFTKEDLLIPRIGIVQQMSPCLNKADPAFSSDASAGMIFENTMPTFFPGDTGIIALVCSYKRRYNEWRPNRGGLEAVHDAGILEETERGPKGEYLLGANQITVTAEYHIMYATSLDADFRPAVLSMSGSQLKRSRQWNAMISRLLVPVGQGQKKVNPAPWWNAYQLTTVIQTNDQGSWYGWQIAPLWPAESGGILRMAPSGNDLYIACREFNKAVSSDGIEIISPPADDLM